MPPFFRCERSHSEHFGEKKPDRGRAESTASRHASFLFLILGIVHDLNSRNLPEIPMHQLLLSHCLICSQVWYSDSTDPHWCSKCGHSFIDHSSVEPPIQLSPTTLGTNDSYMVMATLPGKVLSGYHLGVLSPFEGQLQFISHNKWGNSLAYNVLAAAQAEGIPLARLGISAQSGTSLEFVEVANVRPV